MATAPLPARRATPALPGAAFRRPTAFQAGLSHFPDAPGQVPRLGFVAALTTGIQAGEQLYSAVTAGSTIDKQRQARADYFGQLATQGNVGAAQILLGGTQNTSSNERPYWQKWIDQLRGSSAGQQVLAQAQQLGAWWPVGSTDTVTNYPIMKQYAANWQLQHGNVVDQAIAGGGALVNAATTAGLSPLVLGAGALAAVVLFARKRRR